jgi:antitoxin HicB
MKNVDHYLSLNYHKRLYQDEEGDWIAEVDDLPGCIADGKTPDEAIENIGSAMASWISSRIAGGLDIPEPSIAEHYSGKILVRMPRSLHRRLSLQAKDEGVSLNQYVVSLLVDTSRANLATSAVVQNLGGFIPNFVGGGNAHNGSVIFNCNVVDSCRSYIIEQGFGVPGNNYSICSGSYAQGRYALLGFQTPKQLAVPELPTRTEQA